ncbi:anoctamin-7 isoform X1 [Clupea harengus]|uniref:Anoctamin n=1 Tax=Clupea harengus TaxID=7950 RepID=A0A6P8F118_CLUHA|nr:anoctamin-7 isoform X1 [Clupea harengus]XP_031422223.1 anoctamin-7 isoform X1 [Clupea harengus]
MLRKRSSQEQLMDREVLLDLDYTREPQSTADSYGSLQNGGFIPPRFLTAANDDDDDDPIYTHSYNPQSEPATPPKGNYFRDGKTKIDFVLVWEVKSRRKRRSRGKSQGEAGAPGEEAAQQESRSEKKKAMQARVRERFIHHLQTSGLLLEKEESTSAKKTVHYLKLSAPWDVMVFYAEELCLRAPLQAQPNPEFNTSARVLQKLCVPNIMADSVPNRPVDYYTCAFRKSKMDKFLGSDNQDTYFTNTQRHRIVYEILARAPYGKRKRAEVGVARLLNEGAFTAAFPLHEGPFELPKDGIPPDQLNPRQVLYQYWARWSKWCKYQPLDHIREYFGEKIALYFAWLGFYTAWLLPAALVGTFVFVSGIMTMASNTPAKEICESGGRYLMCPLCETCKPWNMSDICPMAKVGYLFDHPGTVFFSIFMSLWAVTFLEYWKRKNATLAHHWDCMDYHEEEERPRPEFAAMAPSMEQNPVTGVKEPYFPAKARFARMLTGSMVIIIMLCVVMIFLVTVIMYRSIVSVMMYEKGGSVLRTQAANIANISSSMVNLALILLMGQVYTALAEQLTKWEMHRTQTQYEDAFTFKVFIFQFVNFYSSPFYVAFFKGRFVGYPGHYGTLFGMRNEDCGPGGCLIELAEQLFIIMVGKQLINNMQEFVIPKVKAWRQKRALASVRKAQVSHEPQRWEQDYELIECEGLFEEYLEIVLQFGFITIFVAAFPLAPLFALLNNWAEVRLDAHKFVCEYRRPVSERAQEIGVWFTILEALSHLSVIVNAFLIAFTSDFLPRLLYQYKFDNELQGYVNFTLAYSPPSYNHSSLAVCRYKAFRDETGKYTLVYWELLAVRLGFIIAFEHAVFFVLRAIDWMVPDVPESLEVKIKRERYLAKQALADNQEALLVSRLLASSPASNAPGKMKRSCRKGMRPGESGMAKGGPDVLSTDSAGTP